MQDTWLKAKKKRQLLGHLFNLPHPTKNIYGPLNFCHSGGNLLVNNHTGFLLNDIYFIQ